MKQPIKKIRINSNNSISPEFHPATKPLTVEPVDSGNEIGEEKERGPGNEVGLSDVVQALLSTTFAVISTLFQRLSLSC